MTIAFHRVGPVQVYFDSTQLGVCEDRVDIVIQPFFHLQDGAPAADKLAAPVVRISVACTPP